MKDITMRKWWKEGVVYQIYPRSFQDSNGDGAFKVTTLPPIGIGRLKYNLEKAWSLCF